MDGATSFHVAAHISGQLPIQAQRKAHQRIQLGVYICNVLESNRDHQSMTYRKAYERIRCGRSGLPKKLVEIKLFLVQWIGKT
jgi:hypothetical protein